MPIVWSHPQLSAPIVSHDPPGVRSVGQSLSYQVMWGRDVAGIKPHYFPRSSIAWNYLARLVTLSRQFATIGSPVILGPLYQFPRIVSFAVSPALCIVWLPGGAGAVRLPSKHIIGHLGLYVNN